MAKITDIKFDQYNANKGSEYGSHLLEKSINRFGFREASTMDKNGVLIGGNKRTQMAGQLGLDKVEIIPADPNRIYILKYDDIDINTSEGRELALALNATAKANITWDEDVIEQLSEQYELDSTDWGIKIEFETENISGKKDDLTIDKGYSKTHFLISFPCDNFQEVAPIIEQLKSLEYVEIEQTSN